ncbi:2'-5' RNA ligase family protein [Nocardioides caldifontis]|uniref:2'-5' RNA ligase family protein n=1 Tax=Nocardioides caldifontis TaxID=2588938 RepID=UPI0011DFEC69|nr:2'-5' RNA ligase family protein [Nocardioides caldifontis]
MPEARSPFSALLLPVPVADWLVAGRAMTDGYAAGLVVPAHVTLLVPFVPRDELTDGVLTELEALFGDVVPFSFELARASRFPDGPVYLAPDPAAPFRHLVMELARAFPEHPPDEGRFDGVVPHLTVPLREDEQLDDLQHLLDAQGPVRALASEAQLVWVDGTAEEVVEVVARFPFGTTAA